MKKTVEFSEKMGILPAKSYTNASRALPTALLEIQPQAALHDRTLKNHQMTPALEYTTHVVRDTTELGQPAHHDQTLEQCVLASRELSAKLTLALLEKNATATRGTRKRKMVVKLMLQDQFQV